MTCQSRWFRRAATLGGIVGVGTIAIGTTTIIITTTTN
jgi:hypothetical protein